MLTRRLRPKSKPTPLNSAIAAAATAADPLASIEPPVDLVQADAEVEIVRGDRLTHEQQRAAIDVLYQGFRRKLHKLLLLSESRRQIKRILPDVIDFSHALVALRQPPVATEVPCVCGVLLMNLGGKDYLDFDWKVARREFGLLGSVYRRVNYWIVNGQKRGAGELNIQALAVRRGMRCRGVGARLIRAAEDHAAAAGYEVVSLEVVDSNPRAKALYERVGFAQEHTAGTWPYTARAGFRGYDYMVKRVAKPR